MQEEENAASGVSALSIINVGGIFLVLLIGLIFGTILALFEKFWESYKSKKKLRHQWLNNIDIYLMWNNFSPQYYW